MAKKKKVRILVSIASADWSYGPGTVVDLDTELAEKWIESRIAEPVETTKVETATDEKRETAAKRVRKRGS